MPLPLYLGFITVTVVLDHGDRRAGADPRTQYLDLVDRAQDRICPQGVADLLHPRSEGLTGGRHPAPPAAIAGQDRPPVPPLLGGTRPGIQPR